MTDRRRKWDKQQDEMGIIKVCVRVPREYSETVKAIAKLYRDEHKRREGDNQ